MRTGKLAGWLLAGSLVGGQAFAGPVISWVPPYSVPACKTMIKKDFGGGVGMKDGLTYLALQWWVCDGPNVKQWGQVAGPNFENDVAYFRDWGKANGVKITLCVVNHIGGWNWSEARRSFSDNRAAFVKSLVGEVERLGLDGVELDLEGPTTPTREDSVNYIQLVRDLGAALNPQGKVVTVASYAAQYNAPNWKWWPELMKTAAAVTSMGYDEAGMNSPAGWKYPEQKKRATPAHKLMIGMFGGSSTWQGNSAVQHIDWVVNDGQVGVGIWDAALGDGTWESAETWTKLGKIRANTPATGIREGLGAGASLAGMLTLRSAAGSLFADLRLPGRSDVRVRVLDLHGREVAELYRGRSEGSVSVNWSAPTAGAYLISAQAGNETATRAVTLTP